MPAGVFQGSLFTSDFVLGSVAAMADWREIDDAGVDRLADDLRAVFRGFPIEASPNEAQTEDDLIWPVLERLGWTDTLRQQNLAARGRDDVPDGLLFPDAAAKAAANRETQEWRRYQHGAAIVESKRWLRPLDRRSGRAGEETAPATQMLRYLRRVEDHAAGRLRWGILTNGAKWRLYYQGARSVSEQFIEIDLAAVLGLPGHDEGLFALDAAERRHWMRLFALVFRRSGFLPGATDERTFHQRAIREGRYHEERVATNLSGVVFGSVFPRLASAIADAAPDAPLQDVREASLILLYRLLFILYAEDRDLLPVRDARYDDYGLRDRVRGDIGARMDRGDVFSDRAARYWSAVDDLFRAIDAGDESIGLPPYNGGLFDPARTPLLDGLRLGDRVMAGIIDELSFERTPDGRRYINYRDLSVQQLGSIYEGLLEFELARLDGTVVVRPNPFARRVSGSYYTPEELVAVILDEAVGPLVDRRMQAFRQRVDEVTRERMTDERRLMQLKFVDPSEQLLDVRVCDPAMGSGHFLVSLVDYLADRIIETMAETEALVTWGHYVSPLSERIERIRMTILANAQSRGWTMDEEQLDDRHIVRRIVVKRCIYGVDKNPMAVELAKVALWLHTFTVGAPLSFLDHHLRCGDSLFGTWVRSASDRAAAYGGPLLLHGPISKATRAAESMRAIEWLTDAEIAEVHRSGLIYEEVTEMLGPLDAFMAFSHALDWLDVGGREDEAALRAFYDGQYGDPLQVASGQAEPRLHGRHGDRFAGILAAARALMAQERFFNWQVAYPGTWTRWESLRREGGFDAVVGNPPWDRMKLQQVEWFAARRPEIARARRAADRRRMVAALEADGDPLAQDYAAAERRAATAVRVARGGGEYPLLSGGDVNIYALFVERAMALVRPDGLVGLLVPSGIASDKTAAPFFKAVATEGRLKALYDFENRRARFGREPYFPDIDSRFKFCVFVAGPQPTPEPARYAMFVQDVSELADPDRCFPLAAADFARVNPNTGTAPVFRSRRDADRVARIYARLPVLVDRAGAAEVRAWPVRYMRMFDMTNDSGLFRTRAELEEKEGAYPVGANRFRSPSGTWVPLYVGRMVQQFDHRAASVSMNDANLHNPAHGEEITSAEKANPSFLPTPFYWINDEHTALSSDVEYMIAFRDIARTTDVRTAIAAIIPRVAVGNTLPVLMIPDDRRRSNNSSLIVANLNSIVLDYVVRQKVQSTHLNWYIVEQLPVVPPATFDTVRFGPRTAGEIVREAVLELSYTAHDLAPFARDLGHVAGDGTVRPPFAWDERRRLWLRARLDAVFFHLYGVTDRDDVRHVYAGFPIVERQEMAAHGRYLSRDLCLAWISALAAGEPDAAVDL